MSDSKEKVKQEISWYNNEVEKFKSLLSQWLEELNYKVQITSSQVTKHEELSGQYETKEYQFTIDESLKISIKPFGIWLIGAKGRIDVAGPSGSEKFIYLTGGGTNTQTQIRDSNDNVIESSSKRLFTNVDKDDWYWYDDSSYRKVSKFSKEIVEPLLERLQ